MKIKESEVLERIGMSIDTMDMDELAQLHNRLYDEGIQAARPTLQEAK